MTHSVTFLPGVLAEDALANYWLSQVTLRLRREITWMAYERSVLLADQPQTEIPLVERAQTTLDLERFWDEKQRFYNSDLTANYLTVLIDAVPQIEREVRRGSFWWVVDRLRLDALATFALAFGLAVTVDHTMGSVIAICLNDPMKTHPTLGLLQRLWDTPEEALALANPAHPLFQYRLLQSLAPSNGEIDWDSPLAVSAIVANQLLFQQETLPPGLELMPPLESGSEAVDRHALRVAVRLGLPDHGLQVVPVRGPKGAAHRECVQEIAAIRGKAVAHFTAEPRLLENTTYLGALATFCWLRDFDLYLDAELLGAQPEEQARMGGFLPPLTIPITLFLGINDKSVLPRLPSNHLLPILDLPDFSYQERLAHWYQVLGDKVVGLKPTLPQVTRRFRYGKETISAIGRGLRLMPGTLSEAELIAACRAELDLNIGDLAQKVTPRFQDEKLFLPPKQEMQFAELIKAMKSLTEVHYGWGTARAWNEGGISALFAGASGTGKTMAAEILAIELDLPMYRIDLSQVVNKYIGETEKNLKAVFDVADTSDMILFFDEADALFGKRTEVHDSHDRYANIEISYLLERMERFKGLAILATNRKNDLDEAFLRRLRFVLDFPMPDEAQRKAIWIQSIPKGVDVEDVDFDFLAQQFRFAGGHIRSIVFSACLQSANGGRPKLTMPDLIVAIKREYDKAERSIGLDYFGQYADLIAAMES